MTGDGVPANPIVFLAFEWIITVVEIATLEYWFLFVGYCSSSTLGCGSLGACSRQDALSSAPSRALYRVVARS